MHAVTFHPLVQQHSLDQVVVYKCPSYQWDHAVTLSVERRGEERRGERKRARREIAHITLLYMILIQLQHTHTHHQCNYPFNKRY